VKVTIDSGEPLQDALRVVGALYDVRLVVAEDPAAGAASVPAVSGTAKRSRPRKPARGGSSTTPGTAKRSAAAKSTAPVSTLELRSWARQNGFTVSERGRVATKVVAAYRAAHKS
jgi:nucleoid-associated protein Lsr2